jgi:periplasmic protein TonB
MRTNHGTDTLSRNADLNSPAGRFSTRLLMHRANKLQEVVSNLKEILKFHPVKFVGNVSMAQPVWVRDKNMGPSQIVSFAVHGGLALLLLVPIASRIVRKQDPGADHSTIFAPSPDILKSILFAPDPGVRPHGGGTGGENNPIPVTVGQVPRFSQKDQILPPSIMRNKDAVLIVPPTVEGPEDNRIKNPDINIWGDPSKQAQTNSGGPGCCAGMGSHKGSGIGDGDDGGGYGPGKDKGFGGGPFAPGSGNGITYPSCQYCPRPDYSEEARKVKYSGSVMLNVVVLPNGKTGRIEVINSPGMGLDERAVEAVRGWVFKPGVGPNGKSVATIVVIEVIFQLF